MIPSSKDNALKYEPVVMWVLKGARMNQEEEDDDASDNDGGLYAAGTPTLSCFTSPLSVTPLEVTSGLVGQPHNSVGSPLNLQLQQLRQQLQMQQRVPQPHPPAPLDPTTNDAPLVPTTDDAPLVPTTDAPHTPAGLSNCGALAKIPSRDAETLSTIPTKPTTAAAAAAAAEPPFTIGSVNCRVFNSHW
jgi:hypothetical protein